jgi:hypothetical protein
VTAHCKTWGAAKGARRVYGLTDSEKDIIRSGGLVIIHNCPPVFGHTTRRVIEKNGAFYARLPERN